jgi:hypothetical protein
MNEMATIPSPTTTIFSLWTLFAGLGLPSTGSPCRSPSSTGMMDGMQLEIGENTEQGHNSGFKKL